jgi:hypothetical protein
MALSTEEANLLKLYSTAEKDIESILNELIAKGKYTAYYQQLSGKIKGLINDLNKDAKGWVEKNIKKNYLGGMAQAESKIKGLNMMIGIPDIIMHTQAINILAQNTYSRLLDVSQTIGRRTNDIFRTVALEEIRGSVIGYKDWKRTAKDIKNSLIENGVTGFVDKAGKKWNMTSYAEMVSRTTTAEAFNAGTMDRILETGHDLVKIDVIPTVCPICSRWAGKIISLTGKTEGYPTMEDAKADGMFHPRCRHSFSIWIPGMEEEKVITKEEVPIGEVGSKINYDAQSKYEDYTGDITDYREACKRLGVKIDEDVYNKAKIGFEHWQENFENCIPMREYELTGEGTVDIKAEVDAMQKVVKTMPYYDGDIYRGMHLKYEEPVLKVFKTLKSGDIFDIDAFSSFSPSLELAESYSQWAGKESAVIIKINKGTVNSIQLPWNEVLVDKTQLKVISNEIVKDRVGRFERLITCVEVRP